MPYRKFVSGRPNTAPADSTSGRIAIRVTSDSTNSLRCGGWL